MVASSADYTQPTPGLFQVVKVKGHASTTDVDKGLVSVPDKIGNDGAHALALAAAQARRFPFSDRSALQEHDALAFEVHRCMTAVVVARNKESERLGIYAPRRRSDTGGGSDAEDTGNDAPCDSSSVPARFAITKSADQARRLQRKAVQNALAGVERPTHDSDGLPLNEAGRFLHVVYRKSGTFGARITLRGKTTNLGVYPTARDAAVAVQAFNRTGKVERLSKSEAASVAAVRVLHRRVEAHNTTAKTNGKHMFSVSARLLSCNACAAEFTSHDFARACSLICPRLGPPAGFLVDKRGSHTRANTLSATRKTFSLSMSGLTIHRLGAEACMSLTCPMVLWQGLGALCAISLLRGPTRARGCDDRAPGLASFEALPSPAGPSGRYGADNPS